MQYILALIAAGAAMVAAQPTQLNSAKVDARADDLLGPVTCGIDGEDYILDEEAMNAGAAWFSSWIGDGANGQVDVAGRFTGKISYTYNGVKFFACDGKSSGGSIITGNLVKQVLTGGGHIDSSCKPADAGYMASNELVIGRTHEADHFCD